MELNPLVLLKNHEEDARFGHVIREALALDFTGLEESIECLSRHDVTVHLCVVESENGVIALWLTDHSNVPVGVVVIKSKVRA
jgi:hypothetical protein